MLQWDPHYDQDRCCLHSNQACCNTACVESHRSVAFRAKQADGA